MLKNVLAMLKKVEKHSLDPPLDPDHTRMEWLLPWVMLHLATKFHGNRLRGFCIIRLANKQTKSKTCFT